MTAPRYVNSRRHFKKLDDSKFVDLNHQHIADEKNRCATRRFEAHFIKIANRKHWRVFPYERGEDNGKAQRLPPQ